MDALRRLADLFLHLDVHLNAMAGSLGGWLYALLFLIVFCETGLVVTPFLPGDSLLFAVGALSTRPDSPISLPVVAVLLSIAAVLGDAVNYAAGKWVGPKVFTSESSRLLNKQHLLRAHEFYEKYGPKAIVLARFVPIVRTFAPFVAGIGEMSYAKFAVYNIVGGVSWVCIFLFAGYWFADLPLVKDQFHYVILAIIGLSLVPIAVEWWRARRAAKPKIS
jgi:membrane-associated protein